ncbi:hypothetical protein PGT21_023849 [Puccinia graminis f. sp. tritici]|uniref:Secreted protein n=1 Tax=Puccinia graminis f. sp. tritici TaxID=56615 RepID=A0A5B0MS32_PUCGR|nr:hypothetical protein PGT21_023849 [Puccinia graminis f. sp. tritici]
MYSPKLTIALIISVTCGLVTAQFGAVSYNNFSCPNKPHVEGHCIWTRYKKPNDPKSGVDYYFCKSSFPFNAQQTQLFHWHRRIKDLHTYL